MEVETKVTLTFGDGRYLFWLPIARILAFESGTRSILAVYDALCDAVRVDVEGQARFDAAGSAQVRDAIDIIRHGLIGGGEGIVDGERRTVSPIEAQELIELYVHGRPLGEFLPIAWTILHATVHGVPVSKKKPEAVDSADLNHSSGGASFATAPRSGLTPTEPSSGPTSPRSKRTTTKVRKGKATAPATD